MMSPNPFPRLVQTAGDAVPDAVLLRRFVADHDHAAFELLVRRHADAVWAACRQILRHHADAEDAFQATFLALAKKAGSVRETHTLGGWLYRVAVNAALKLRNQRPESPAHEELARLADKYRLPVVLCDLEGHTHAEVAAVLGWPVGTVAGRLSRARDQLKARLLRRGIVGPVVLTAVTADSTLAGQAAAAALGTMPVSSAVSNLSEGVLSAMSTLKLKLTGSVAVGIVCITGAGMYLATGQTPRPTGAPDQANPAAGQANKPVVRKVQKLKDGRLTAYPELVFDYSEGYKDPDPSAFGVEPVLPKDLPESDIRQLHLERVRQLTEAIRLDNEVLRIGSWDVPFLNQFLQNLEELQKAAKAAFPSPADHLYWLRRCVAMSDRLESVVYQRVFTAINLRKQQYHQTDAVRLRLETELNEAEVAAKNAAPGGR